MTEAPREHESVDRLIEAVLAGEVSEDALGVAAKRVRALSSAAIPPEARERHLALIRSRLEGAAQPVAAPGPIRRRLTALAAGLATLLTLGGGGTVAFAQNAQPGDPLYGLKRATERVRLAFAGEDEDTLRVQLAERRLEEAAGARDQRDELLRDALEEVLAATDQPGERAIGVLASLLQAGLPDEAAARARVALAAACERIADRAGEEAPPACRSPDAARTSATDDPAADTEDDEGRAPDGTPAEERRRDRGSPGGNAGDTDDAGDTDSAGDTDDDVERDTDDGAGDADGAEDRGPPENPGEGASDVGRSHADQ